MNTSKRVAGALMRALFLLGLSTANGIAADLPPLSHSLTTLPAKPAPALNLKGLDGQMHALAQLRGKVVLVNFWATWCPPCRREMPSMERLSHALDGEPFAVLAIDVGEDIDSIDAFTSQLDTRLHFPILLDSDSRALQNWKVAGLPTTFLVDKQGRIVGSAIGGREFDHPELVKAIRTLLNK